MRNILMGAVVAVGLLAGCENNRESKLASDQDHLAKVQAQAADDMAKARADAAKEKDRADNEAANRIAKDRKDVAEARAQLNKDATDTRATDMRDRDTHDRDTHDSVATRQDVTETRSTRTDARGVEVTTPILARGEDGHLHANRGSIDGRTDVNNRDVNNRDVNNRDVAVAHPGVARTLTGTLGSTSGKTLTVRDRNGQEFKLKEDDRTQVLSHGRNVKIDDFREGTQVRASYVLDGNDRIARDVQILADHPVLK